MLLNSKGNALKYVLIGCSVFFVLGLAIATLIYFTYVRHVTKLSDTGDVDSIINISKDSGRLQDMDTLKSALNLALLDGEIQLVSTSNCKDCNSATGKSSVDGKNGWVKFTVPVGKMGLSKYLVTLPSDPDNKASRFYSFSSNGTTYELNAELASSKYLKNMKEDKGNNPVKYELGSNLLLIN